MAREAVAPADLTGVEIPGDERIYAASQWQLMWWRLRKHRLAMGSGFVLLCFYAVVLGAGFLATSNPRESNANLGLMKPQPIR